MDPKRERNTRLSNCILSHLLRFFSYLYLQTARPAISCPACGQGAKSLERNLGGTIALIVTAGLAFLLICWRILRRRAKFVAAHLETLKERRLQRQKLKSEGKSERKRAQVLVNKFLQIQKRLDSLGDGAVSETSSNTGSSNMSMKSGGSSGQSSASSPRSASPNLSISLGKSRSSMRRISSRELLQEVMFRSARGGGDSCTESPKSVLLSEASASSVNSTRELQQSVDLGQMFDVMEEKCRGRLDYQALNRMLQLTPLQLEHFVTRMNELGKYPVSNTLVTREVFCKNFFRVLEESLYFEGSTENASKLFDEMEQYETNAHGEVNERTLYRVLSTHLSDPQISLVITKFRRQRGRSRNVNRASLLVREASGRGTGERRDNQWTAPLTNLTRGLSGGGTRSLGLLPMVNESGGQQVDRPNLVRNQSAGILPKFYNSLSIGRRHNQSDDFHSSLPNLPRAPHPGMSCNDSDDRRPIAPTPLDRNESSGRTLSVIHFMRHSGEGRRLSVGSSEFTVGREEFVTYYPIFLKELEPDPDAEKAGMDVAFENLSLNVKVGGTSVPVVDSVTGRIAAGQMTALMGGSGAGKTSLLNALCGRAFYGEVTGTIRINGQLSTIEENRSVVGFVPQVGKVVLSFFGSIYCFDTNA